jgi:predicted AlkP superfamily phosphohydrolase/phosphomutase
MSEARMPTLRSICGDGASSVMRSTIPPNSAVGWTSLSTGANPGRHGLYDFVLPFTDRYGYRVATRQDRRVPALWSYASAAGARVAVVNIPMTFPAEPVNGVMVSGMDAPSLDARAVHPAGYLDTLQRIAPDYRIVSRALTAANGGRFDVAARELVEVVKTRAAFVRELARVRDLDLVMVNLEATDGAQHFFWEYLDERHPRHDPGMAARYGDTIAQVYGACDQGLSQVIEAFDPDTVFVVSDHGGVPTSDAVLFMNDWLVHEGFLSVAPNPIRSAGRRLYGLARRKMSVPARRALRPLLGSTLDRVKGAALYGDFDWSRSRAYTHMQPAVRLNLAGREPEGIVRREDREAVLDEIVGAAAALRLPSGDPAFSAIHRVEDVYTGDAPGAPDLVMETAPGLHIRFRNTSGRPGHLLTVADLGTYLPSGVHGRDGMVAAAGTGVRRVGRVEPTDIHQVASSVLAVMAVPHPTLDGAPFDFISAPSMSSGSIEERAAPGGTLSEQEEAEIMVRLRALGYTD